MPSPDSVGLGKDLGFFMTNQLPGEADATGGCITPGVAKPNSELDEHEKLTKVCRRGYSLPWLHFSFTLGPYKNQQCSAPPPGILI